MLNEPTMMDATRRMLLKKNLADSDADFFPLEDLAASMCECTKDHMRPYLVNTPSKQESLEDLRNISSILRCRKRRRTSTWFLNSGHHPRLPLLALSKYSIAYHIMTINLG